MRLAAGLLALFLLAACSGGGGGGGPAPTPPNAPTQEPISTPAPTPPPVQTVRCGDSTCTAGSETCSSCPQDCGACGGGALATSGPVSSSGEGQVIEGLRITVTSGPAIRVTHPRVTIRNVQIAHAGGPGILVKNAAGVTMENVVVEHTGAPASGPNPSTDRVNIVCEGSANLTVNRARLSRGSSGIYMVDCPRAQLRFIQGFDFRGPFPRGQLVQFNGSSDGLLEDFSDVRTPGSWPEDNVNVYRSSNVTIRRGHIDGNNAPSGVGVIFDGGANATGLVEDVDAIRMGNGCFSGFDGGSNITFRRTRCRENICGDGGRGKPRSNALMWAGKPGTTGMRIEDSRYFKACNPSNLIWPPESFAVKDLREEDFTMRPPLNLKMPWE